MDDLPNPVKKMILSQELDGIKQQIYRLSISAEARKVAGYSEEENKALLAELERFIKLRDVIKQKLVELDAETSGAR